MTPADMTPIEMTMVAIFGLVLVLRNWWELVRCQLDAGRQQLPVAELDRGVRVQSVTAARPFGTIGLPKVHRVSATARRRRHVKMAHLGHRAHKAHHH